MKLMPDSNAQGRFAPVTRLLYDKRVCTTIGCGGGENSVSNALLTNGGSFKTLMVDNAGWVT